VHEVPTNMPSVRGGFNWDRNREAVGGGLVPPLSIVRAYLSVRETGPEGKVQCAAP